MAEGSSASSDFYDSSVRRVTALAQIRTDALSAQLAAVTQELEAARLTTRSANAEKAKESLKCRGLEEQLAAERRATAKAVKEAESCRAATAIARDAVDKSGEQLRKVSNQLAATQAKARALEERLAASNAERRTLSEQLHSLTLSPSHVPSSAAHPNISLASSLLSPSVLEDCKYTSVSGSPLEDRLHALEHRVAGESHNLRAELARAQQAVHVAQEEAREHKIRAEVVLREFTALSDELESRRVGDAPALTAGEQGLPSQAVELAAAYASA